MISGRVYCQLSGNYNGTGTIGSTTKAILSTVGCPEGSIERRLLPALQFEVIRTVTEDVATQIVNNYTILVMPLIARGVSGIANTIIFEFNVNYGSVNPSVPPIGTFTKNNYNASFENGSEGYQFQSGYPYAIANFIRIIPNSSWNSVIDPSHYNPGDTYLIDVEGDSSVRPNYAFAEISMRLSQQVQTNDMAVVIPTKNLTKSTILSEFDQQILMNSLKCECVEIPEVFATISTNIEGTDIGEAIFTILDKRTYYEEAPLVSKCGSNKIERCAIKETRFDKCCPFIVSVVRGRGCTLRQKVEYIWDKYTSINLRFDTFYGNLIIFAMARYIFARILYGCFNIDLILGRYYDEFLIDLGKSRFCRFVPFFTEGYIKGYNKYIKY